MAHFNPEGLVTKLEVEADSPLGPRDVVAKAERSKNLTRKASGCSAKQTGTDRLCKAGNIWDIGIGARGTGTNWLCNVRSPCSGADESTPEAR